MNNIVPVGGLSLFPPSAIYIFIKANTCKHDADVYFIGESEEGEVKVLIFCFISFYVLL